MKIISQFIRTGIISTLCILLAACERNNVLPPPTLERPTKYPVQTPADMADLIIGQAPTYSGIKLGVSHKRDVLAYWGEPNVTRVHDNYESLHYFNGEAVEFFLIKDDVVQAVTSNVRENWLRRNGSAATADDLMQLLGASTIITPVLGTSTQVFPNYGVAVSNSIFLYPYQYFVPMSLQAYSALWGKVPLGYDPFPPIPSVDAAGVRPGQTTRSQLTQLLGTPDQIIYQNRNAPWLYFMEPDMLGQLYISFDEKGVVDRMYTRTVDPMRHSLRLEDIMNQYGQPDTLLLMPGREGTKYETLALLYLKQGLRVDTACAATACNIVRRDAVVGQKLYFQPTTLIEYQGNFPVKDAAYVEWHGFDQ